MYIGNCILIFEAILSEDKLPINLILDPNEIFGYKAFKGLSYTFISNEKPCLSEMFFKGSIS